ncbi:hypothetical protein JCM10207_002237 [Rhodosporidiobolus poonsookiae]
MRFLDDWTGADAQYALSPARAAGVVVVFSSLSSFVALVFLTSLAMDLEVKGSEGALLSLLILTFLAFTSSAPVILYARCLPPPESHIWQVVASTISYLMMLCGRGEYDCRWQSQALVTQTFYVILVALFFTLAFVIFATHDLRKHRAAARVQILRFALQQRRKASQNAIEVLQPDGETYVAVNDPVVERGRRQAIVSAAMLARAKQPQLAAGPPKPLRAKPPKKPLRPSPQPKPKAYDPPLYPSVPVPSFLSTSTVLSSPGVFAMRSEGHRHHHGYRAEEGYGEHEERHRRRCEEEDETPDEEGGDEEGDVGRRGRSRRGEEDEREDRRSRRREEDDDASTDTDGSGADGGADEERGRGRAREREKREKRDYDRRDDTDDDARSTDHDYGSNTDTDTDTDGASSASTNGDDSGETAASAHSLGTHQRRKKKAADRAVFDDKQDAIRTGSAAGGYDG